MMRLNKLNRKKPKKIHKNKNNWNKRFFIYLSFIRKKFKRRPKVKRNN